MLLAACGDFGSDFGEYAENANLYEFCFAQVEADTKVNLRSINTDWGEKQEEYETARKRLMHHVNSDAKKYRNGEEFEPTEILFLLATDTGRPSPFDNDIYHLTCDIRPELKKLVDE